MILIRLFLYSLLKLLYRVEVHGMENFHKAGKRVMIVANHTSFLDGMLLAVFFPEKLSYAVNTRQAKRWFAKPFLSLVDFISVDPTNPMSLKALIGYLQEEHRAVIFPEGRITVTGSLMKIYQGPGMVADKSGATILPVRIDGAQYSPASRLEGLVRIRWFPKIRITVLPPTKIDIHPGMSGHDRRVQAGQQMFDIMKGMMFETSDYKRTLFDALLEARIIHGGKFKIVDDIKRKDVTYNNLISHSAVLARALSRETQAGENVGVMLPNSVGTLLTILALQLRKRVPAMINFGAGERALKSSIESALIKTIYTSREFIENAKLEPLIESLSEVVTIRYLEDVRSKITVLDKLHGLLAVSLGRAYYKPFGKKIQANDAAVLLFTSGSEGLPKGVLLSHSNLLSNLTQVSSVIDFSTRDVLLNVLPMFHSFGLTVGTLLPVLSGIRLYLYPSPLHYRIIPELSYDIGATVLLGTSTFLNGYARHAHPYDFYTQRLVIAGAEKLSEDVKQLWVEKFGIRITEGYGVTETSPVLAANTPMEHRKGTVGKMFPGIEYRLKDVPGIEEGKRLQVRGPNIMMGYLLHDKPGELQPPEVDGEKGWYDTGDIVSVDEDGYISIVGRAKRFAKIGGEMISLAACEELVSSVWPNENHAVVSLPDASKGEQLVLVTEYKDASASDILQKAREEGVVELYVPRKIIHTHELPLLGTGKVDYPAVSALAEKELA